MELYTLLLVLGGGFMLESEIQALNLMDGDIEVSTVECQLVTYIGL
jgi:hypothetical protein